MSLRCDAFATSDLAEAEQHLQRNYGDVALRAEALSYEETSVGDERFALGELRVRGGYRAAADVAAVTIAVAERGYRWSIGDARGDAVDPVLFQPGAPMSCEVSDAQVRVVVLPLPALTDVARTVYNDDRIDVRFDAERIPDAALRRAWRSTVDWAFGSTAGLSSELVRTSVFRALAVTTLEAFPLAGDRRHRAGSTRRLHLAYRRAVRFLEDHASLPITVVDAASAAGVSSAELDRAFHAYAPPGHTPAAHLLAVRLDAAHSDLRKAHVAEPSLVREIAHRWGFTEHSLTRHHVRAYGIAPLKLLGE